MKISVIIHTYNAEKHLERVLKSVQDFDEIIICDMYSTDKTIEIANSFPNCTIVYHENTGYVEPARNFAISQASNNWILIVDADEVVPIALKEYLYTFIKDKSSINVGLLSIPRKNYTMGRFARTAYPDYVPRFVRKESIYWPPTIHSHPEVKGTIVKIPKKRMDLAFIHLANESISSRLNKINVYSNIEVERRKNKNYNYWSLLFNPFYRFIVLFIIKGGFRDGVPGLIRCAEGAYYKFLTIAKVIESKLDPNDIDPDLKD